MTQSYTEQKLKEIERDIITGMDKQKREDKDTAELAASIARRLCAQNKCEEPYMGVEYLWGLTQEEFEGHPILTVMCYDKLKLKIVGPLKYKPMMVRIPFDRRLTFEGNVTELVLGALKHKNGSEQIVEEDDV